MATERLPGERIVRDADLNYPWVDWFNGSLWELRPGFDFKDPIATFRQRCYRANRRITGNTCQLRTKYRKKAGIFYLQLFQRDDLGDWVPVNYDPAPALPRTGQDRPAPSAPPAQPDGWTPAPPHLPR
jgi:hypothetical protein